MPQINGFSPTIGAIDTHVMLDVGGLANFPNGVTVWFGGDVEADIVTQVPNGLNAFRVEVAVPQGAQNGPIHVVWRDGQLVDIATPGPFQVVGAPVPGASDPAVTAWNPRKPAPGASVIVTGRNLLHVRSLLFRNSERSFSVLAFSYQHDADLSFRVPPTALPGDYRLSIGTQTGGRVNVAPPFSIET